LSEERKQSVSEQTRSVSVRRRLQEIESRSEPERPQRQVGRISSRAIRDLEARLRPDEEKGSLDPFNIIHETRRDKRPTVKSLGELNSEIMLNPDRDIARLDETIAYLEGFMGSGSASFQRKLDRLINNLKRRK